MLIFFGLIMLGCCVWAACGMLAVLWAVLTGKQKINTTEPYTSWHLTHEPHKIK